MAEEFFGLAWWVGLLIGAGIGAAIGAFLQIFIHELFPLKWKEGTKYWTRKLRKRIRPPEINVRLVVKTRDISHRMFDVHKVLELLETEYRVAGYEPAKQADSLLLKVPVGKNRIGMVIDLSTREIDDALIVDQVQCNVNHHCGYRRFSEDILEMREAQKKIEPVMRKSLGDFMDDISLVCELSELYELTGILSDSQIGTLRSSIEGGKVRFDLSKNILTVYGKDINAEILSLLKKMITIYY